MNDIAQASSRPTGIEFIAFYGIVLAFSTFIMPFVLTLLFCDLTQISSHGNYELQGASAGAGIVLCASGTAAVAIFAKRNNTKGLLQVSLALSIILGFLVSLA